MHIGASEFSALGKALAGYDRQITINRIAALFTIPELHPNSTRLEILVHLACVHCSGKKEVSLEKILGWINHDLQPVAHLEDPVTDVFVGNIMGPGGNYRILRGIWEGSDYYLQSAIDTITHGDPPPSFNPFFRQIFALLKLSDTAIGRCGLDRWTVGGPVPKRLLSASSIIHLKKHARSLLFTENDLVSLGVRAEFLEPFILNEQGLKLLRNERVGNSSLERYPLLQFNREYLLASPTSISPAIRRYILEWMKGKNILPQFASMLRLQQGHRVLNDGLRHIETEPADDEITYQENEHLAGLDQVICKFDTDKYAHIVLIHDDVLTALNEGLDVPQQFADLEQENIGAYLISYLQKVKDKYSTVHGLTLIIFCGLGRGYSFATKNWPTDWHYCAFTIAEFMQFADSMDRSMLRLWKLLEHYKKVTESGLYIPLHHIGFLNLYSYWVVQNYTIVPDEMPYPKEHTLLQISLDFLHTFNKNIRQAHDKHAAFIEYPSRYTAVSRLLSQAFFETITNRPIYASLPAVERKELDGIIETKASRYWILYRKKHESHEASRVIYQLWEALLFWLDRLLPELEKMIPTSVKPVYIEFNIEGLNSDIQLDLLKENGVAEEAQITLDREKSYMTLKIPLSFLRYFNVAENIGERKLLLTLGESIIDLLKWRAGSKKTIRTDVIVQRVMSGIDARMVHIYETQDPEDMLASIDPQKPRFVQPEDEYIVQLGLSWKAVPQTEQKDVTITGEIHCKEFLSKIVDEMWIRIATQLSNINRASVIEKAFINIEGINQDQTHWKRTAKAMLALYKDDNVIETALKRDTDRNLASITSRVLIEMALCAAPLASGNRISQTDLDELLAKVTLMIEFASDSDAIHHQLSNGEIKIAPNGVFRCDRSFIRGMVEPFVTDSFATGFNAAADAYAKLHEKKPRPERVDTSSIYSAEFIAAFTEEYGLTPDRVIDVLAELLSLAWKKQKSVVLTNRDEISILLRENRSFNEDEIAAFFESFSLMSRERWDLTPKGYRSQDWWPWRFRRRLSLVVRPLAVLSNDASGSVMYGVSHIADGFKYIFDRIESAWLPQEFFKTKLMRNYIGNRANVLGHAFAEEASNELNGLGWQFRLEVQMTELGASAEMGDVDVVSWRKNDNRLLLIECKRLQPTRTIWEIGDLVSEFKGVSGDRLAKHIRRCEWIRDNIDRVIDVLKLPQRSYKSIPLIVTNAHVPFKFWKDLAIPSENVIKLESLKAWLHKSK